MQKIVLEAKVAEKDLCTIADGSNMLCIKKVEDI